MTTLFTLTLLASVPAFVLGLINPKWVLPGIKSPTRALAAGVYAGTFFGSFILLFLALAIANPPEPVSVEPAPAQSESPSPSPIADSPAPESEPSLQPAAEPKAEPPQAVEPERNWKSYLPEPDPELRSIYEADPYLSGWLAVQDVWIGRGTSEELVQRGFFVNAQWRHNGLGTEPTGEIHGSCSVINFDDGFICGRGAMGGSPFWGVQDEKAIDAFQRYMN